MQNILFSILSVLSCTLTGFAQNTDFSNYRTLQSSGDIPADFTRTSKSKMLEDLETKGNSKNQKEKIFYEGINYAIDDMLHSGMVVYGDPVSSYASEIVDRLLQDDPETRKELRVYTIKSNSTNAFSTDQGIIFVTTGLVAQTTSEAQIAYVLAHEIAHYKRKHVKETYEWKQKNYRYNERIDLLSNHSKEKEFEADKDGIAIYHKAGYSLDAIFETFDVLMYSYLPFDEVEFPVTYFNTENLFVPESLFPKKKYPIQAEEDYDDSNSSHPNIKKRKEAVEKEIGAYSNWGESAFFLGETRFIHVRNICRFENVRSDILDASYGDALYSIFLLEKDFPSSMFLKHMKSQAWLNLAMYKRENKSNKTIDKSTELEGESAAVHFMLKKLSKDALFTVALRNIYDAHKANPEDEELKAIYTKFVRELGSIENFKTENYSKKKFSEAAEEFMKEKADTTAKVAETESKTGSKYDRIKKSKNVDNPSNFDSTKFYLYSISDILADNSFVSLYKEMNDAYQAEKKKEEEIDAMSRLDREKHIKKEEINRMRIGLNEVIVVEPTVQSYTKSGIDQTKSEEIGQMYSEMIEKTANDVGVKAYPIDRRTLSSKGTIGFNERNVLISFLGQIAQEDDVNVFPVDYSLLTEIQNNYGTSKVMFTLVEHVKQVDINWWLIGGSMVLYPAFPFVVTMHIPMAILNSNKTEMNVIILDLEKGLVETGNSYYFHEPVYRHNLGAHIYDVFHNLNQKPQ